MAGLLLGSVTHKVMQLATVPVLVHRSLAKKELATAGAVERSAGGY
jgi:hypothetical protein